MSLKNAEARRAYFKSYREKNASLLKAKRKARYQANAEAIKARVAAYRLANYEKVRAGVVRWTRENPERHRASQRKATYKRLFGISVETYNSMLEAQGYKCALCGAPPGDRRLDVDHCHEDGNVRGLLCYRCNMALGLFREDPTLLRAAADYIDGYRGFRNVPAP